MMISSAAERDAIGYALRRARRERCPVLVYVRNGVVYARAEYEPAPEGAVVIFNTAEENANG
jgi:hypothetical protein